MPAAFKFLNAMRQSSQAGMDRMFHVTLGELSEYDPQTHSGNFKLVMFHDDNGDPIETGKVPLGTPYTGVKEGAVFPIATGAQALIFFVDANGMMPMGALFLFNDVDTPPFTDGKTFGWMDANQSFVKTTNDDKGVGVRMAAKDYGSLTATKVELGRESLEHGNEVVRQSDLAAVVSVLNDLIQKFNTHTHTDPQGGVTGVPSATEGQTAQANGSTVVFAE